MSMIKKFFQKRKLDVKFKRAGEGHRLDDDRPQPSKSPVQSGSSAGNACPRQTSSEAQRAAEAALARNQHDQPKKGDPSMAAKARMRRELELEKKKEQEALALAEKYKEKEEIVKESVPMAPILFKCPELGPMVLPRNEMEQYIEEFLLAQLAEEPEMASALMIHTLSKDTEKVKGCIDILCKYLENIKAHPSEEKYRKIRVQNKAFSERVAPLKGTGEFLQAAGFELKTLPFEEREESFYVMNEEMAADSERIGHLMDVLHTAERIQPQLDRAMKVFHPSSSASKFNIPDEFYSISPEELKKEQQRKQEAVETLGMLRTKAMREREERRELLKYKFTLIRVRFPDGILLQGTFKATEKLSALQAFVRENLENDWMPFQLCSQVGGHLKEENKMLAELSLTPAAVVNFEWDKTVMAEVTAERGSSQLTSFLKQEVMAQIQSL